SQGFQQLGVPMTISGVSGNRVDEGAKRGYLVDSATRSGSSASEGAAGADTLVAGGSLAAVMSTGDVTYAGVGTVTAVCDGRVVGFGHPMQAIGDSSYGLGAADVVMVQEDPLGVPFKASNIGDVAGTIDSDRLSGIAGNLGPAPASTSVVSNLTYGSKSRTGQSDVYLPDALASVAFYGQLGNHDSVLDHYGVGSETQSWVIEGTDENGDPFTINYDERYQSSYDIAVEGSYPLADTLWALTNAGATVTSVTSTADVSDDDSVYRVKRVEQKVDGKWENVTNDVAKVAPGDDLKLRALVLTGDTSQYVDYTVTIPQRVAGGRGYISMFGGGSDYLDVYGLDSTAEVMEALEQDPGNDTVGAKTKIVGDHGRLTDRFESAPFDLVVNGRKYVEVKVKGGSGGGGSNPCARVSARGCRS
ncbi:MAG TPA: hypothetical protein VNS55_15270, partial [Nocardioides sp.]|nr:hypothetical protein [Nocardioides sp.]